MNKLLSFYKEEIHCLTKEKALMKSKIINLEQKVEELSANKAEKDIFFSNKNINDEKELIEELEEKLQLLHEENQRIASEKFSSEEIKFFYQEEIRTLNKEKKQLLDRLHEYRINETQKLEHSNKRPENDLKLEEIEKNEQPELHDSFHNMNQKLKHMDNEITSLKQIINGLRVKNKNYEEIISELQERNGELAKEKQGLITSSFSNMQGNYKNILENEISSLNKEKAILFQEIRSYQDSLKDIEGVKKENESLKEAIQKLTNKIDEVAENQKTPNKNQLANSKESPKKLNPKIFSDLPNRTFYFNLPDIDTVFDSHSKAKTQTQLALQATPENQPSILKKNQGDTQNKKVSAIKVVEFCKELFENILNNCSSLDLFLNSCWNEKSKLIDNEILQIGCKTNIEEDLSLKVSLFFTNKSKSDIMHPKLDIFGDTGDWETETDPEEEPEMLKSNSQNRIDLYLAFSEIPFAILAGKYIFKSENKKKNLSFGIPCTINKWLTVIQKSRSEIISDWINHKAFAVKSQEFFLNKTLFKSIEELEKALKGFVKIKDDPKNYCYLSCSQLVTDKVHFLIKISVKNYIVVAKCVSIERIENNEDITEFILQNYILLLSEFNKKVN